MVASQSEVEHPTVTVLTLKARISEDGTYRVLDETVIHANWTCAPGMDQWDKLALERARALALAAPRIEAAQAKYWLGEVQHLEAESRTGGSIWEQAADELRHEALDTLGVVGVPLRRSHSTRPVSLYGQWTVDLVFSGSDHQAVRAAFDAEVPQAAADWAAHPERFPRVEMPKNGRVAGMSKNTPEAVRRAAQALPRHPPSLQNPVRRCLAGGAMLKTCGSVSGGHAEGVPSRLIL
jgi:hypothetical protein